MTESDNLTPTNERLAAEEPPMNPDDTQPNATTGDRVDGGVPAPPRFLMIAILGLFLLGIIGFLSGIVIFREVFNQGQQQRVIDILPFMEAFQDRKPTPEGGILQRAEDADTGAASDLLNLNIGGDGAPGTAATEPAQTMPESTEEPTQETTPEVTEEAQVIPPTPTPAPTEAITPTPTEATSEESAANTSTSEGQTVLTSAQTWNTSAFNTGYTYYKQSWNNCGPATISIALSYYGWQRSMEYAADRLKPNSDDKNVSPWEMVDFVEEQSDLNALYRMGGDLDLLRTLIHNKFPVIIERGQRFEGTDWLGHYQPLVGYDDNLRQFLVYDTFLGSNDGNGRPFDYAEVDGHWREFNRMFIVIYDPAREAELMDLLGDYATLESSAEIAFNTAQEEARINPQDEHAWFNMGTSLTAMQQYEAAATAFDRAFDIGVPWRILWYQFGPYEAYYETGRFQDVLDLVNANLQNGGDRVEETYYWQGRALAELGYIQEARSAFNRALSRNRLFDAAREALDSL